jgi:hypothetical protein
MGQVLVPVPEVDQPDAARHPQPDRDEEQQQGGLIQPPDLDAVAKCVHGSPPSRIILGWPSNPPARH